MPDISGLVTTAVLNTNIGEVDNKLPDISGLVTTAVLNTKIDKLITKYQVLVV